MKRINFNRIALGLATLIVYSAAGLAAGLAIWYFVGRQVELWRYDPTWVSTGFLVTLMAAGYIIPEVLERLQGWFSQSGGTGSKGGWGKSFRLVVSAILVPLAVFIATNRVPWLSTPFFPPPSDEYQLVSQVADTVMATSSSATRVAGIETLGAVSSKDSLDMLTKMVEQQPSILNDPSAYAALAKAIASYGPEARGWLLKAFQAHLQPAGAPANTGIEPGLYERYFQPSFSDLQAEIKAAVPEPARQNYFLLELSVAESTLKTNLADLEAQQVGLESGYRTLDFVLDTLADTKLSDDAALAGLAKQVAGNGDFGVGTRRRAILLVAQFGTTDDRASLLPYLQDSNETLRAAALTALKDLYQKPSVGTSASSGQ